LAVFAAHGSEPKRLLTDNAWAYTRNRALPELLSSRRIRHLTISPGRPQTNGKVERYQQTRKREWALGQIYRSSDHRADALSHWLRYYNERRPHSALGGLAPISRVRNVVRHVI
jgi:transposase InsO family protein